MEAEEKMRGIGRENAILRESNTSLLDSAYNLERERQFQASENALKVQIAQLEATLKADLIDQRSLQVSLLIWQHPIMKDPLMTLLTSSIS